LTFPESGKFPVQCFIAMVCAGDPSVSESSAALLGVA